MGQRGAVKPPAGYKRAEQHHPDPFDKDKPLYTITAQNAKQVQVQPDPRAIGIVSNPTTFKMPVYESRRTHTAPDWVIKNTRKNAETAELKKAGTAYEKAYGGIPFPIPQWNGE